MIASLSKPMGQRQSVGTWHLQRNPFLTNGTAKKHTTIDGVTYKVADCREEREAAFRLVYQAYTRVGLMEPNAYQMRLTPYHLLPTTDVFIAVRRDEVICAVSLIGDGELGIPMETIYREEVSALRKQGVYVAELSGLADCRHEVAQFLPIFVSLNALIGHYSRQNKIDQILIAVHPKHERFYRRFFGFKRIGPQRSYPSVGDKPAVAAAHDFAKLDEERYPLYDQIYQTSFARWELVPQPMMATEREYFRSAAELCDPYIPMAA